MYMDLYCERINPGLWAEPINFGSNIAFFIAAWAIWQLADRQQVSNYPGILMLISLTGAIAIGSSLFHLFATQWAYWLDVIPILLFQLCYLWLYLRQIIKLNQVLTMLSVAGFFGVFLTFRQFQDLLNGSMVYFPAFLVLLTLGIYHFQQSKQERFMLLSAAGVFLVSLTFRTIDQVICPYFSLGTHFLWHLLNGGLLYLSARGLIVNWPLKFSENQ